MSVYSLGYNFFACSFAFTLALSFAVVLVCVLFADDGLWLSSFFIHLCLYFYLLVFARLSFVCDVVLVVAMFVYAQHII